MEEKKQHDNANREDDKTIKELEKQLHLNKRKKKGTLPASFKEDGLDCILDACFNSLAPGRCWCDFKNVIFNLALPIGIFKSSYDNVSDECHRTLLMISQHWFR